MMFLTDEQIRFQKSCAKASLGYASAFNAASGVVGTQVFSFWLEAFTPGVPSPAPRSRGMRQWGQSRRDPIGRAKRGPRAWGESRRADVAVSRLVSSAPANGFDGSGALTEAMESWLSVGRTMAAAMGGGQGAGPFGGLQLGQMPNGMDPAAMMGAWLDMDWSRAPASWPMAVGMMSMGVPKAVASPMAEANLAMMEAFGIANSLASGAGSTSGAAFQPFAMPGLVGGPDFFKGMADRHSADGANPFAPAFAHMFFKF